MRIARFRAPDGTVRGGVVDGDEIVAAEEVVNFGTLVAATSGNDLELSDERYCWDEIELLEPLGTESRLFALGGAYPQHLRERGQDLSPVPSQWYVPDSAVVGPGDAIRLPERVSGSVLPAVELGVVIGEGGRYIDAQNALDYVAGYTVVNDVTARTDWPGPMAYKLLDTFSPCGPLVTTADEVASTENLKATLHRNGERICHGSTAGMRFTISFIVSFLSTIVELRPGDIISTGDPGRVESSIEPGDTVTARVEEVGELTNSVIVDR